jgi:hypothetical protein
VHLNLLRLGDRLQTLHPRDDPLLILLVLHHPLQKIELFESLLRDLEEVLDVGDVAVDDEGDSRPQLHVPEGTLLALETQEVLHVVSLLAVHHRVVVYVGLVLDQDQVPSSGSRYQLTQSNRTA